MNTYQKIAWKILIVDEEREFHELIKSSLGQCQFEDRGFLILSAYCISEAEQLIKENSQIVIIFLTLNQGQKNEQKLKLVDYLRNTLQVFGTRIIAIVSEFNSDSQLLWHSQINDIWAKKELYQENIVNYTYRAIRSYLEIREIKFKQQEIIPESSSKEISRNSDFHEHIEELYTIENKLLEQQKCLEKIVYDLADAILIIDKTGVVKFANSAAEKIFGNNGNRLLYHDLGIPVIVKRNAELDIIISPTQNRVGEMSVTETKWEGESVYLVSIRDITERKKAEEKFRQLAEKEKAISQVMEKMRQTLELDKIFKITTEQVRLSLNCYRVCIFQFNLDWSGEFVSESVNNNQELWRKRQWLDSYLQENQGGKSQRHEMIAIDDIEQAGYSDCYLESLQKLDIKAYCLAPIFVGENLWGLLAAYEHKYRHWSYEDIQFLRQVGNHLGMAIQQGELCIKLRDAKESADLANKAKSNFLANISHEISTPINIILGFTSLLTQHLKDSQLLPYVKSIDHSSKTLLALLNDILDLSKIEAEKLELYYEFIDLRELITEIRLMFSEKAKQKNIDLQVEIAENFPKTIYFDQIRLRQILFNVVGNSLKFTEQGYVKIVVKSQKSIEQNSSLIQLELTIEDTGIGIALEEQEQIFEAFTQSKSQKNHKHEGTGLGLAITKRLTEMLGGRVYLRSELNKGSSFTFIFPSVKIANKILISNCQLQRKQLSQKELKENLAQFPTLTLLIADDVRANRRLIEAYFENSKHNLYFARDGIETIKQAENCQPDVILLDLKMPNMNGEEVVHKLKNNSQTKDIPIILLTGFSLNKELESLLTICQGYLRKPINISGLISELRKVLTNKI